MTASPVYVALDVAHLADAQSLARCLAGTGAVGGFKIGLELFAAAGPEGVRALGAIGLPMFLDLKLHDIPNTVAAAMRALAPLAPAIMTVHAGGGHAMLRAAKTAAPPGCRVVAVTVLTSLTGRDLAEMGMAGDVSALAAGLAATARAANLDGVVCSAAEVAAIKRTWPECFAVVPGIRPEGSDHADQKRAATPAEALAAGADVLVVGRPITGSPDPAAAARALL